MSSKCLKNDKECPYQKELREKENKIDITDVVVSKKDIVVNDNNGDKTSIDDF